MMKDNLQAYKNIGPGCLLVAIKQIPTGFEADAKNPSIKFHGAVFEPSSAYATSIPQALKIIENFDSRYVFNHVGTPLNAKELFDAMNKIKPQNLDMEIDLEIGRPVFVVSFTISLKLDGKKPDTAKGFLNYFILENLKKIQVVVKEEKREDQYDLAFERHVQWEETFKKLISQH